MSTTFAIATKSGELKPIARRVGGGVLGVEMYWTDDMAEMLPDETKVTPTDNSAQGIHTIGDIRDLIRKQLAVEQDNEAWIDTKKIEVKPRNSAFVTMTDAWHKEHDYVEVTDWTNGEGWDIAISDKKIVSLHFTEFEAIKALIEHLGNQYECYTPE
jgi:hypothetical protein